MNDLERDKLNTEYLELEEEVKSFILFTNNVHFKRLYSLLQELKRECYRPAINVEKKELDKIHAIHGTIMEILDTIPRPVKTLTNFISENQNKPLLFDVEDIENFYEWEEATGTVKVIPSSESETEIETVTLSCPQTGQSVTTTPEKIEKLANKAMGKKEKIDDSKH